MAENRSRFRLRYTQAQKDAILKAVLLDGLYVAEAIRRAARGELGLAAFTIGDYAYDIVKNGRDDFEGRNDEALARGTEDALKAAHRANLKALRSLKEDADPTERARVAKAVADTQRSMAKPKPSRGESPPKPEDHANGNQSQSEDVLARLLNQGHKPNDSVNGDVAQPTSQDDEAYSPGVAATSEQEGEDSEASEGADRFARSRSELPIASASH